MVNWGYLLPNALWKASVWRWTVTGSHLAQSNHVERYGSPLPFKACNIRGCKSLYSRLTCLRSAQSPKHEPTLRTSIFEITSLEWMSLDYSNYTIHYYLRYIVTCKLVVTSNQFFISNLSRSHYTFALRESSTCLMKRDSSSGIHDAFTLCLFSSSSS